jgi:hypothetical protein
VNEEKADPETLKDPEDKNDLKISGENGLEQ